MGPSFPIRTSPANSCAPIWLVRLPLATAGLKPSGNRSSATMRLLSSGEAEAGAAADIIVMDYKPYTPFSDENIDGHMIFGMTGRQCQTTIAAGKTLMLDRQLVGIDEEAENAHILEAAKKLWGDLNHRTY